jgi:hypothetical protein
LIGYSFLGHVEAKLTGGFSDRNVRSIWMIKIPLENASSSCTLFSFNKKVRLMVNENLSKFVKEFEILRIMETSSCLTFSN